MGGFSIVLILKGINNIMEKQNGKRKLPHTVLERRAMCFSSYKNRKLKVKVCDELELVEEKKRAFFVPFILSGGVFLTFLF